jgi:hypothetical protein
MDKVLADYDACTAVPAKAPESEPFADADGVCRHCGAIGIVGEECSFCEPQDGLGPMIFQRVKLAELSDSALLSITEGGR